MLRSLASNMLTVLIFGFFLIGAIGIWGKAQYVAEGPLQNAICFKVKSGTSMRTVVKAVSYTHLTLPTIYSV